MNSGAVNLKLSGVASPGEALRAILVGQLSILGGGESDPMIEFQ